MDIKTELNELKQSNENLTKSVKKLLAKNEVASSKLREGDNAGNPKKIKWKIQAFGLLFLFGSWLVENRVQNSLQDTLNTINSIRIGTYNLELKEAIQGITISKYITQPPTTQDDSMTFKNSLLLFCGTSLSIQSNAIEMFYLADRRTKSEWLAERQRIGIEKTKLNNINNVSKITELHNFYKTLQSVYLAQREHDIQELSDLTQNYYAKIDTASDSFFWFYLIGSFLLAFHYLKEKGLFKIKRNSKLLDK